MVKTAHLTWRPLGLRSPLSVGYIYSSVTSLGISTVAVKISAKILGAFHVRPAGRGTTADRHTPEASIT